MARSYEIAANRLFTIMSAEQLPLMDPTYFLYAHTVELALKALLQAHSAPAPLSHGIGELFEDCRAKTLVGADPNSELHNLIVLLGSGNEGHRYRYGGKNRRARPHLSWVHEAVRRLMQIVEAHVTARVEDNALPPPKRFVVFGKPSYTRQPIRRKSGP